MKNVRTVNNIRAVNKTGREGQDWYALVDIRVELLGGMRTAKGPPRTSAAYINKMVIDRFPDDVVRCPGGEIYVSKNGQRRKESVTKGALFVNEKVLLWLQDYAKEVSGSSEQAVADIQTVERIKDHLNIKESPKEIMRDLMSNMFDGHDVRTAVKDDGSVWFVLKDVCDVIGVSNQGDAARRLGGQQKSAIDVIDTSSNGVEQKREMTIVSEDGLYDVLLTSNKPKARNLLKWVTKDVLPSIRKTGGYGEVLTVKIPDTLAGALRLAADQAEATERALGQARAALQLVEEAKPKVDYYDKVLASEGDVDITTIAKELGIRSGAELNRLLERLGVQWRMGSKWELKAAYVGLGYARNVTEDFGGKPRIRLVWTQKGRKFIHDLINQFRAVHPIH